MLRVIQSTVITLVCLVCVSANAASWSEIRNQSSRVNGFMPYQVSKSQGKIWLEVNEFNQPFIMYTGLPYGVGSNDIGLDRGQLGESRLVQFEKYGNKILLKQLNTRYRADSDNMAEKSSVKEAFASSVLYGFKIEARSGKRHLIDITPFLMQDLHGISERLEVTNQGSFNVDSSRSAVLTDNAKNFPKNTAFESLLTFTGNNPGDYVKQVVPSPGLITIQQQVQFVALPDGGYEPRQFHPKSGFFALTFADYATPLTESIEQKLIYRHRITRDEEGNIKPIVYYLDPGAPEPVKTALLEGARWWAQAFDAVGLEGAYEVKVLPEDVDPLDVRYNVIQWVHRATRGWSYGMALADPRTGEIIKGHVTLGSLRVRQDLLIANALTGSATNENKQQKALEMALARIRQLSAHEVGHTLGLAHNFAASVNNRASVMDYPHPFVTLQDGKISLEQAYAEGIGRWDIEAVRYGYAEFQPEEEAQALRDIVRNTTAKGLFFISDPDARPQGGSQSEGHLWDNGTNPAHELNRVLEIRQHALQNFGMANLSDGQPFSELAETLVPLYLFHRYQVEAAVKWLGGTHFEYSVKGDSYYPVRSVDTEQQLEALEVLLRTLSVETLLPPESILKMIPPKAYGYSKTRESFPSQTGSTLDPIAMADVSAQHTLKLMLHPERLARLLQQKARDPELLGLEDMLSELLSATLRATESDGLGGLIQQRVDYLTVKHILIAASDPEASAEVRAHLHSEIGKLGGWLTTQAKRNPVRFLWLKALVDKYQAGDFKVDYVKPLEIPPGSPIGN
ncbi:zinc-dependent metalloprotease [Kangiella sediminilitoris]|uniref:Peptidase n=1 Tax=Kangiella sediminilitoris TaxID=1144748 RepID=A0A1B3B8P6_9GAMM|nr:zinc-dependent metalloprotease [Kangiella sediminilitoris]AOE49172.1 peptidase [Kangiella sediminilitoris]